MKEMQWILFWNGVCVVKELLKDTPVHMNFVKSLAKNRFMNKKLKKIILKERKKITKMIIKMKKKKMNVKNKISIKKNNKNKNMNMKICYS